MTAAAAVELPEAIEHLAPKGDEPPQNLKEYDPEWTRAFLSGTATINCDHAQMLRKVKVPVLFTHHFRKIDPTDGTLMGAVSDLQVEQARRLIEAAGQRFEYHSYPLAGHFLHAENPALYTETLFGWAKTLNLSEP
jgi:pimeloyl-ACP methyl ester carboxylesterase